MKFFEKLVGGNSEKRKADQDKLEKTNAKLLESAKNYKNTAESLRNFDPEAEEQKVNEEMQAEIDKIQKEAGGM